MLTSSMKVDVGVVSRVPTIDKEVKRIKKEILTVEEDLKKDKNNKAKIKELADKKKELAYEVNSYTKIEELLAANLATLDVCHRSIAKALQDLSARKDLPAAAKTKLTAMEKINDGDRKKQLAVLDKLRIAGDLRSEPAKLKIIHANLEEDIEDFNTLDAGIEGMIDAEFEEKWKVFTKTIDDLIENADVAAAVKSDVKLPPLLKVIKAARWKNYDKYVANEEAKFRVLIETQANKNEINKLLRLYPTLNNREKHKLINEGREQDRPNKEVKKDLDDLLAKQRKPSKSKWIKALDMPGYKVVPLGKFQGIQSHLTFDLNSWSEDADGKLDITGKSAANIMDALFALSDFSYEVHVTLEIEASNGKNPKLYFGGTVKHPDKVAGKDDAWRTNAEKYLNKAMDDVKNEMKAKIKAVIDADGIIA